jgi:hypothetical protein
VAGVVWHTKSPIEVELRRAHSNGRVIPLHKILFLVVVRLSVDSRLDSLDNFAPEARP